jgi:hypothetical protein
MTPLGLSVNYVGALDGMVLAFMKYMRCLLDHTLTCQRDGAPCDPKLQFGIVFYPAILIFSLIWQLLGGLIRFMVSIMIFFFTLFTPPEGGPCQCWTRNFVDGYGDDATGYFNNNNQWFFGGFCYACRTPNVECPKVYVGLPGTAINSRIQGVFPCRPYCPVFAKYANPGLSDAAALSMCISQYTGYTPKLHTGFTALEICTGRITVPKTVYQFRPDYQDSQAVCTIPACVPTIGVADSCFTTPGFGLCNPPACGSTPGTAYMNVDMCPDPTCQNPANFTVTGIGNAVGIWPNDCGTGAFWDTTPNDPLVTCGALQIINAFLDVFRALILHSSLPPTKADVATPLFLIQLEIYSSWPRRIELDLSVAATRLDNLLNLVKHGTKR